MTTQEKEELARVAESAQLGKPCTAADDKAARTRINQLLRSMRDNPDCRCGCHAYRMDCAGCCEVEQQ
jgi:hypothetical protein